MDPEELLYKNRIPIDLGCTRITLEMETGRMLSSDSHSRCATRAFASHPRIYRDALGNFAEWQQVDRPSLSRPRQADPASSTKSASEKPTKSRRKMGFRSSVEPFRFVRERDLPEPFSSVRLSSKESLCTSARTSADGIIVFG